MFRVIYDSSLVQLDDAGELAYVMGSGSTVKGGSGADTVAAVLRSSTPEELSTELSGGKGNDTLNAALTLDGVLDTVGQGQIRASLSGGAGMDLLELHAASYGPDQYLHADGGSGRDHIVIRSGYAPGTDYSIIRAIPDQSASYPAAAK